MASLSLMPLLCYLGLHDFEPTDKPGHILPGTYRHYCRRCHLGRDRPRPEFRNKTERERAQMSPDEKTERRSLRLTAERLLEITIICPVSKTVQLDKTHLPPASHILALANFALDMLAKQEEQEHPESSQLQVLQQMSDTLKEIKCQISELRPQTQNSATENSLNSVKPSKDRKAKASGEKPNTSSCLRINYANARFDWESTSLLKHRGKHPALPDVCCHLLYKDKLCCVTIRENKLTKFYGEYADSREAVAAANSWLREALAAKQ